MTTKKNDKKRAETSEVAPEEQLEGNTKSSSKAQKKTDLRPAGAKRWPFTWNNYPENWVEQMAPALDGTQWIGGHEICPTTGTPHIQGYVEFPEKVRPAGRNGIPKTIHWGDKDGKPCKANRKANVIYCTKTATIVEGNIPVPRKVVFPKFDKWWQKEVVQIIKTEPDDRSIFWYHGPAKTGKTTFCKYLVMEHGAILVSGKGHDVRNAICTYLKDTGDFPRIVVFPIPKSFNSDYLHYDALENIKDMLFYSGKYEGGQVAGPCPHLFVFSNEEPEYERMSADRWKVKSVEEGPEENDPAPNPFDVEDDEFGCEDLHQVWIESLEMGQSCHGA